MFCWKEVRKGYFGRKFYLLLGQNELSNTCALLHFALSRSNFSNMHPVMVYECFSMNSRIEIAACFKVNGRLRKQDCTTNKYDRCEIRQRFG